MGVAKRRTVSKQSEQQIRIDLRTKKNLSSELQLIKRELKDASHASIPDKLKPMLATKIQQPFDDPDWLFEIKWDGYRSIAYVNNGNVQLRSRNNLLFNNNYKIVVEELYKWGLNIVVDGEIVVLNEEGKASFDALQTYGHTKDVPLVYYIFDLLWLDGLDLTQLPLYRRKEILKRLAPESGVIKFSDSIDQYGVDFFKVVESNDIEGIVAKKKDSTYEPGERTKNWLKITTEIREDFVIGGWTESDSGRSFKSLIFGYYDDEGLKYDGHSGGGYKSSDMKELIEKLQELETKKKPFVNDVDSDTKVHWVKPKLVAEFKYASRTESGKIRKPAIFLGLRPDKEPKEVHKGSDVFDDEADTVYVKTKNKEPVSTSKDSNWPELEKQVITSETTYT